MPRLLSKRRQRLPTARVTGLSHTVAGLSAQIDQLVGVILNNQSSDSERITAAEVVRSYVDFQNLSSITEIWYATNDLLALENATEVRRAGWRLTRSCIARDELNNSAFTSYYAAIVGHSNVEDFDLILSCLDLLTKQGRVVIGSQAPRQLPSVLIEWLQLLAVRSRELRTNQQAIDIAAQWGTPTEESFHSLVNYTISLLKFRMAIWEPADIEKLLLVVVAIVRQTSQISDCRLCCTVIETVMAFGLLLATVLQPVLEVLCGLAAMVPALRDQCVDIIRALSRSHLQNSTFVRLCRILDTRSPDITQSMRVEAAVQLKNILTTPQGAYTSLQSEDSRGSTPHASKQASPAVVALPHSTVQGNSQSTDEVVIHQKVLDDATVSLDVEVPVVEVLECYYRTLLDPNTPLRLVVAILDCFIDLVVDFGMLRRVHTTSWIWPRSDTDTEILFVSPLDMVNEFSHLYVRHSKRKEKREAEDIKKFRDRMGKLASSLTSMLLDKSLNTNGTDLILLCTHTSHFMSTESCEILLEAVEMLQFCTPGIIDWFEHLKEIMLNLYVHRTDSCRAHVLQIVKDIYSLNLDHDADWISAEDLAWITETTFGAVESADPPILEELLQLYETRVFFSEDAVFSSATKQLGAAIIHGKDDERDLKVLDTLTVVFRRAYKLQARQALAVLDELQNVCLQTQSQGNIFARAWGVLSRLRSNRWDRLLLVDHLVEDSYGRDLLAQQEPLPKSLAAIHSTPSLVLKVKNADTEAAGWPALYNALPLLQIMVDLLRNKDAAERTFIVILINAAPLVAHFRLFQATPPEDDDSKASLPLLRAFRNDLISLVASGGAKIPCKSSSLRQACLCVIVHILTVLVPFTELFPKTERDRLVQTVVQAMNQWNLPTSWATHFFTVTCYEAQSSLQRYLPQVLSRLQLKITSRDSNMYILDFMFSLSLEGSLTKNFTEQDFKRVFGMCFSIIQNTNHHLQLSLKSSDIVAQWLLRLAYSAISHLFLSIRLERRRALVPYLVRCLIMANEDPSCMDPMSLVVYDLINRFTYSDTPLRAHMDAVPKLDPSWEVRKWLWNVTVIEIRCNRITGEGLRIVRRPAGISTMHMTPSVSTPVYDPLNPHDSMDTMSDQYAANFHLLCVQLGIGTIKLDNTKPDDKDDKSTQTSLSNITNKTVGSVTNVDTNAPSEEPILGVSIPITLPEDAATNRAISAIDRVPIVDFYKIGIIYVAPGQRKESEILANESGSDAYRSFLHDIGVLIRLKNNKQYYVGGLDTEQNLDGEFALAWSNKISQIIFHTTTMMPNNPNDPSFAGKKRHIGNNFVNIYFDESGEDFEFDVVKSQFNFINIFITPTYSKGEGNCWKVRAYRKPGMLNTLVAYDLKVVSDENMALFVRNLALKASQYAAIHTGGAHYKDNWVYRLQLITSLRDRVTKQLEEQIEKKDGQSEEQMEEGQSFLNEDDFATDTGHKSAPAEEGSREIKLLKWMDFTRYTM